MYLFLICFYSYFLFFSYSFLNRSIFTIIFIFITIFIIIIIIVVIIIIYLYSSIYFIFIFIFILQRLLIERSRELSKKSKELEELKGTNSVYLASLEKRYIDETALYKKRSGKRYGYFLLLHFWLMDYHKYVELLFELHCIELNWIELHCIALHWMGLILNFHFKLYCWN